MHESWYILFALVGVALAVWLVVRLRRGSTQAELAEPDPVYIEEEVEEEELPPVVDLTAVRQSFLARYQEMFSRLTIPPTTLFVDKVIDIFALKEVQVAHYFWKADGALHTFPVWASVESLLNRHTEWPLYYTPESVNNVSKLTFSVAKIQSYSVSPETGEVTLRHLNFAGHETVTVFCGAGAAETFAKLIPEKQAAIVERRAYLSSAKNISDMKTELQVVRDQWIRGLISKEEYERQKIACVLRM